MPVLVLGLSHPLCRHPRELTKGSDANRECQPNGFRQSLDGGRPQSLIEGSRARLENKLSGNSVSTHLRGGGRDSYVEDSDDWQNDDVGSVGNSDDELDDEVLENDARTHFGELALRPNSGLVKQWAGYWDEAHCIYQGKVLDPGIVYATCSTAADCNKWKACSANADTQRYETAAEATPVARCVHFQVLGGGRCVSEP